MELKISITIIILTLCISSRGVVSEERSGTIFSGKKEGKHAAPDSNGIDDDRRFMIKFKKNSKVFSARMENARRKLGDKSTKFLDEFIPEDNIEVLYLETEEDVRSWENSDEVEIVEKDSRIYLQQEVKPYGISAVKALDVSDSLASNRKVCIIDSGYDISHVDLPNGDAVTGANLSETEPYYEDGDGHGTHVAGTIAAIGGNGKGVMGVIRNGTLKLHIVRIFNDDGDYTWASSLISAVNNCVANGANIVNLSLGSNAFSYIEEIAYSRIYYEDDVLLVAAAGNDGNELYTYPASYPTVLSVAAVDNRNIHASFSNENNMVDISAPGVNVLSTYPGNRLSYLSGTSMATPHVSGVAALVWSHYPEKTAQEIVQALVNSALDLGDPGQDKKYGHGLVQADEAMKYLSGELTGSPTVSQTNSPTASPTTPGPGTCVDSPLNWYDSDGPSYNCDWYALGVNCLIYGDLIGVDFKTAKQACCVCGGGYTYPDLTEVPMPTPSSSPIKTPRPSPIPTSAPTLSPTHEPTAMPTPIPTSAPTPSPTHEPTSRPTPVPTSAPTLSPTREPTAMPTPIPTSAPTLSPTHEPTSRPTPIPTLAPTLSPTPEPTAMPTSAPTSAPTLSPTLELTSGPTPSSTLTPTLIPTPEPTSGPTPTQDPTSIPSELGSDDDQPPRENPFNSEASSASVGRPYPIGLILCAVLFVL